MILDGRVGCIKIFPTDLATKHAHSKSDFLCSDFDHEVWVSTVACPHNHQQRYPIPKRAGCCCLSTSDPLGTQISVRVPPIHPHSIDSICSRGEGQQRDSLFNVFYSLQAWSKFPVPVSRELVRKLADFCAFRCLFLPLRALIF